MEKLKKKLLKKGDKVSLMKLAMLESDAEFYLKLSDTIDEEVNNDMLICFSVEEEATQTSFRHQMHISEINPLRKDFNPKKKEVKFYHAYNGFLYELESTYLGSEDGIHQWDIINLKPETIYVGLSFSLDGGKTILPSSAVYGITKDTEDLLPTPDDALLAYPKVGAKKHRIWWRQTVTSMYGAAFTRVYFSLIAKKHYEADVEDEYITLHRAACETAEEEGLWCLCKKYTWLKTPIEVNEGDVFTKEEEKAAKERIRDEEKTLEKVVIRVDSLV